MNFGSISIYFKLCKILGCNEGVFCKGYCVQHYHSERRLEISRLSLCFEDDCKKKIWKSNHCRTHYEKSMTGKKCIIIGCERKSVCNRKCDLHTGSQPIICRFRGCEFPVLTSKSGLCSAHYHQTRRILKKDDEMSFKKKKIEKMDDTDADTDTETEIDHDIMTSIRIKKII